MVVTSRYIADESLFLGLSTQMQTGIGNLGGQGYKRRHLLRLKLSIVPCLGDYGVRVGYKRR